MSVLSKNFIITMPDGSEYAVPVMVIARSRASEYAAEFGGDVVQSLADGTVPLFEEADFHIRDWAQNNMNWCEVKEHATLITPAKPVDVQEGWINGDYRVE